MSNGEVKRDVEKEGDQKVNSIIIQSDDHKPEVVVDHKP